MQDHGPDPNYSYALVHTFVHKDYGSIPVYIGNQFAYAILKKKHPNIHSICCYGCDKTDPNVKPVFDFLDTTNTDRQSSNKAKIKILDGAYKVQQSLLMGHEVLVHCHMGINRSAAIICAWAQIYQSIPTSTIFDKLEHANESRLLPVLTNSVFRSILLNQIKIPQQRVLLSTLDYIQISVLLSPEILSMVPCTYFTQS